VPFITHPKPSSLSFCRKTNKFELQTDNKYNEKIKIRLSQSR
jgi:hypothetical protein